MSGSPSRCDSSRCEWPPPLHRSALPKWDHVVVSMVRHGRYCAPRLSAARSCAGGWDAQTGGFDGGLDGGPLAIFDANGNTTVVVSSYSQFMASSFIREVGVGLFGRPAVNTTAFPHPRTALFFFFFCISVCTRTAANTHWRPVSWWWPLVCLTPRRPRQTGARACQVARVFAARQHVPALCPICVCRRPRNSFLPNQTVGSTNTVSYGTIGTMDPIPAGCVLLPRSALALRLLSFATPSFYS